jgi:hypothetical protein
VSVVPAEMTVGAGAGGGAAGRAGVEFELEVVAPGEVLDVPGAVLDVAEVSDEVPE